VKDAFDRYVVHGRRETVNPALTGTKAAAYYVLALAADETATINLRLASMAAATAGTAFGREVDRTFATRVREADEFYRTRIPDALTADERAVARQAYAGLLWSKQFYHYAVDEWLEGDPAQPAAPSSRQQGRNAEWTHVYNADVISMPDKWEYPWYAAWDLAFHTVSLANVDPAFAKEQLILLLREWYMHPNGQILASELGFGDVNPPVHAWARTQPIRWRIPRAR
jgi:hypothetical protein